jgi:hypothetical protein
MKGTIVNMGDMGKLSMDVGDPGFIPKIAINPFVNSEK